VNGTSWSWLLFGTYCLIVLVVTVRRRSGKTSFRAFSIGSRNLPPLFIGLSVAAGSTSTATFVVNPGLVYLYGWSGFVAIFFASSLGFFVGLVVFSKSFRRIGDEVSALTVPQWIGDRYESDGLRLLFSVLSLLQIAYVVLIVVAMTLVLATTLEVSTVGALLFVVLFTYTYISFGGAGSHILANVVQASVMVVVALILMGSGWHRFREGAGDFFGRLAEVAPHYASLSNPESQLYRDAFEVFVAQFAIGVAAALLPHLISKALYLRTERDVNVYLGTAIVAVLLFKGVLLVGLIARLDLTGELLKPDQVMATYIVETFSPLIRAFVGLGVLAAGFSTLEGILLSLSTVFTNDVVATVMRRRGLAPSDWEARALVWTRGFIVLLVPVTVWLSYRQIVDPSLSVIIFAFNGIFGLLVASFVPILFGIYCEGQPVRWIAVSSVSGVVSYYTIVFGKLGRYWDNPMVPGTYALALACAVMACGMIVSRGSWQWRRAR